MELIIKPPAPPTLWVLPAPAAAMPTSSGVDCARRLTEPVAAVTVDPEITAETLLLMRFQLIETPTPFSCLPTASAPVTATSVGLSIAFTVTDEPAKMVEVPPLTLLICASTTLVSTLMEAEPATADLLEPAPPRATETMTPRSSASTVTQPLVERTVEFSTRAVTVFFRTFNATAMP